MWRNLMAILVGVISGSIVVGLIEMVGHWLFPVPESTNLQDPQAMREWINSLPTAAFLPVLAAWAGGSFAGAYVAARLSSSHARKMGLVVGGLLMIGAIVTLVQIPHPIWFTVIGLILFLPMAFLGARLATAKHPSAST